MMMMIVVVGFVVGVEVVVIIIVIPPFFSAHLWCGACAFDNHVFGVISRSSAA